MTRCRVHEVMTTEVITAAADSSVAQLVALLNGRQIGAVPIVDGFDVVLGVVSWADLHRKISVGGSRRRRMPSLAQWPEGTAVEVMSAPPLTIAADASLPAAARAMYRAGVRRLLVVGNGGRLRGIVTRSDLLKVHARLDDVIREDVVRRVLDETLRIPAGTVHTAVADGVVTLTGHAGRRTTALAAVRLTATLPGVTDVIDRLGVDRDDTVAPATVPAPGGDHARGRWTGWSPSRPAKARSMALS